MVLWEPFWKMVPFLVKKAPKQFPFGKMPPPHQKGTAFQNSALRASFSTNSLRLITVPFWKQGTIFVPLNKGLCFCCKKGQKWCCLVKGYYISATGNYFCMEKIGRIGALLQKGTKIVPQRALFYGPSNGNVYFSQRAGTMKIVTREQGAQFRFPSVKGQQRANREQT